MCSSARSTTSERLRRLTKWLPIASVKASSVRASISSGSGRACRSARAGSPSGGRRRAAAAWRRLVAARPVADGEVDGQQVLAERQDAGEPHARPRVAALALDALEHVVGAAPLPGVEHLVEEVVPVLEVPVEAAAGDAEPLGERLDPHGLGPSGGERVEPGVDPRRARGPGREEPSRAVFRSNVIYSTVYIAHDHPAESPRRAPAAVPAEDPRPQHARPRRLRGHVRRRRRRKRTAHRRGLGPRGPRGGAAPQAGGLLSGWTLLGLELDLQAGAVLGWRVRGARPMPCCSRPTAGSASRASCSSARGRRPPLRHVRAARQPRRPARLGGASSACTTPSSARCSPG